MFRSTSGFESHKSGPSCRNKSSDLLQTTQFSGGGDKDPETWMESDYY